MARARAIMVLGTASDVGKSLVVAALCRLLSDAGLRVAPFKAQNMSLNSAATPEGLEIGRAQALQAQAARVAPRADMNPVLLKPGSNTGSQAIVQGRVAGRVQAHEFGGRTRERFWPAVVESYHRLASDFEIIVLEGAGSVAEINLREGDIVNMAMAHEADARCMLLADIDRGGVFASLFGTLELLDDRDRSRFDAFAINKFRGDLELLKPGILAIEQRIHLPCAGVIPHAGALQLDEEDGVALERRRSGPAWRNERDGDALRVAVVPLPHLANFTDFDALASEPSIDLRYLEDASQLVFADVVILPGSKETVADLEWLRIRGLERAIRAAARDRMVLGICGGMQMCGREIDDPHRVESGGCVAALQLLDLRTTLEARKTTVVVRGTAMSPHATFGGYEIHNGETTYGPDLAPFATIRREGEARERRDGARSSDGRIAGTYVHGLFGEDLFRRAWIAQARAMAGLPPAKRWSAFERESEERMDAWAALVRTALDLRALLPELGAA